MKLRGLLHSFCIHKSAIDLYIHIAHRYMSVEIAWERGRAVSFLFIHKIGSCLQCRVVERGGGEGVSPPPPLSTEASGLIFKDAVNEFSSTSDLYCMVSLKLDNNTVKSARYR